MPLQVSLAACLLPQGLQAWQVDAILSEDVTIDVQKDGWLEVTEKLRVRVKPKPIQGSLERDFPRGPYKRGRGRVSAPFEVLRLTQDGRPHPFAVHAVNGGSGRSGIRVEMGRSTGSVAAGDHTYTLTYRTNRWLDFEGDRTRLHWQLDNPWSVPILSASAGIRLPGQVAADAVTLEAWRGPVGTRGSRRQLSTSFDADTGSVATVRTTGLLNWDESLSVDLAFPGGVVSRPTPEQEAEWARLDWRPYTDVAGVVWFVLLFFMVVWAVAGRAPPAGPVVVQYEPPKGFSPAGIGYLDNRGYDGRHLTATILSLAMKGVLEIEATRRDWTVRRIGPIPPTLPPDERAAVEKLLPDENALVILGISRRRMREARQALRRELKRRFEGRYFVGNRGWIVLGFLLSVAGLALSVSRTRFGLEPEAWLLAAVLLIFGIPFGRLLTRGYRKWRTDLAEMTPKPTLLAASVWPLLMTLPLGLLVVGAREVYQALPLHLFVAVLALSAVNGVFYQVLERPTVSGQNLLSQVEGFKRFLVATEADRLERLSSEESQELYEHLLPYAVALGMKNRWAANFGDAVNSVLPS